ncbi:hypothetical protein DRE_04318 [Drechslerella stenobrocha 248]|uniref:Uncharacterized protein n=1 Tax=Drechslerella stenobrocha 248 TaxID=1043628 RepID=W7IB99_9PEZI|nr:hypothetical protein DRE_04318 [Drechslerella stenobrocha 248]
MAPSKPQGVGDFKELIEVVTKNVTEGDSKVPAQTIESLAGDIQGVEQGLAKVRHEQSTKIQPLGVRDAIFHGPVARANGCATHDPDSPSNNMGSICGTSDEGISWDPSEAALGGKIPMISQPGEGADITGVFERQLDAIWQTACEKVGFQFDEVALPSDLRNLLIDYMVKTETFRESGTYRRDLRLKDLMIDSCFSSGVDAFKVKMPPQVHKVFFFSQSPCVPSHSSTADPDDLCDCEAFAPLQTQDQEHQASVLLHAPLHLVARSTEASPELLAYSTTQTLGANQAKDQSQSDKAAIQVLSKESLDESLLSPFLAMESQKQPRRTLEAIPLTPFKIGRPAFMDFDSPIPAIVGEDLFPALSPTILQPSSNTAAGDKRGHKDTTLDVGQDAAYDILMDSWAALAALRRPDGDCLFTW